ncbi:hypothetical protein NA57DRAFT_74469 [Rhizodiscina lignyota]|uniref:Protein phosphatase 4 core regulatory subunit R2 n=1 Tax=Rhizodiscina lignyota TaxID=1504668 RepID=A0A9P4M8B1_9PEZI|nr:hypothetical protein NA57DRAFT_74469 [Rhizodiscina lignyota]
MATTGEELLESATHGDSILSENWPEALETILSRLEHIIKNEFPIPTIPAPDPPPPPLAEPSSQSSTSTNKENAPPRPPVPSFSASTSASQAAAEPTQPNTQQDTEMLDSPSTVPSPLMDLYELIKATLTKSFSKNPPHTIQRLAELILRPREHYRHLPSYLRAVDRVVCVSSSANIFPLPQAVLPPSGPGGLLNGATNAPSAPSTNSLGSDESLGGALLTPIPWLKSDRMHEDGVSPTQPQQQNQGQGQQQSQTQNELKSEETEMVEGPNGVGRIETVSVVNGMLSTMTTSPTSGAAAASNASPSDSPSSSPTGTRSTTSAEESLREAGAVTQGELLRLEQEAGVVPVSVATRNPTRGSGIRGAGAASGGDSSGSEENADVALEDEHGEGEAKDEVPHARGPEEISAEDVGPGQERLGTSPTGGLDMEKAVGRSLPHGEGSGDGSAEQRSDVEMKEAPQQESEAVAEEGGEKDTTGASKEEDHEAKETAPQAGADTEAGNASAVNQ